LEHQQLEMAFHILGNILFRELRKIPTNNSLAHSFVLDLGAYDTPLARIPWPFDCGRIAAGYTDNPADSPEW
jgi:hypothetical protein